MTHRYIGKTATHVILMLMALVMLFPFYWMLKTSFLTDTEALQIPPEMITWPLYLGNYLEVFVREPMLIGLWNSLKIATISTTGVLMTSSMAAFAFAKIRFRYSNKLFALIFGTMLIPQQVLLFPMYVIFSKIGWTDTHYPLILPQIMINAYGVFLIRQFMVSIPDSYIEAAEIDGLSIFGIYRKIALPLCKPALVTLGMFTFIGNWNNFIGPLIYLDTESKFTLPLIMNAFRTAYTVNWGLIMTAATISVLPIFILYLIAQRSFIEGISMTGLKG